MTTENEIKSTTLAEVSDGGCCAVADGSAMAIRELNRMLRFCGERPGGAVMCQRMEGAADARHAIRKEIRERIRLLSSPNNSDDPATNNAPSADQPCALESGASTGWVPFLPAPERFERGDKRRFHAREYNGRWEVYSIGLDQWAECDSAEKAQTVANALELLYMPNTPYQPHGRNVVTPPDQHNPSK